MLQAVQPSYGSAPRKLRVVIADDSILARTALALSCSVLPQVELVGQAVNGQQTLELVRQLTPDVLTLDMRMPELDGLDVLRRLQDDRVKCTVIVITAGGEGDYVHECARLGAKYFYDKSTEMEKVSDLLRILSES